MGSRKEITLHPICAGNKLDSARKEQRATPPPPIKSVDYMAVPGASQDKNVHFLREQGFDLRDLTGPVHVYPF